VNEQPYPHVANNWAATTIYYARVWPSLTQGPSVFGPGNAPDEVRVLAARAIAAENSLEPRRIKVLTLPCVEQSE
jgi:hypothetical protein